MKADWKNEEWSDYLYNRIPNELLEVNLSDGDLYYQGYNSLTKDQKREFFVMLFSSLARFESAFNPAATYKEAFNDVKGKPVISTGLFQVSVESLSGYGVKTNQEDLKDPFVNILAMLAIAKKLIVRDGCIAGGNSNGWKSLARYWSPFRKSDKIAAIRKNTNSLEFKREEKPMAKQARLAIIVGHESKSKGAYSKHLGESEYTWNSDLARMMRNYALETGLQCEAFLRDGVGIAGAVKNAMKWKPDCIIELHFNAADGKASGTETLYADTSDAIGIREVVFAKMVNDSMVQVLGTKDRGIKKLMPGGRGYGNLSGTKSVPSILVEPFFGDNKSDCASASKNKQSLARAIVSAFKGFKGV